MTHNASTTSTNEAFPLGAQQTARSMWISPLGIFWSVWLITVGLYDLHLSMVLIYPTGTVTGVVSWIVIPFSLSVLLYLGCSSPATRDPENLSATIEDWLNQRLKIAFALWASLTALEVWVSGGVPILWLIQGSPLTYTDFGIPSVHGLLNSLLLAIGLTGFALFAHTRKKQYLSMPASVVLWSLIAVTRGTLVVMLIECAIVWVMIRGITWKTLVKGITSMLAVILVFGYVGDMRTGSDGFRQLADPSPAYPDWLPSGALWVYIYVSTPINNLVNTAKTVSPAYDLFFPNATAYLLPSILRNVVYGRLDVIEGANGDLVVNAFTVSTAYVGPLLDYGMFGVVCFSIVMGTISAHYWRDQTLRGSLAYAVLGQCLVLSVFFNMLFYLPVITQIPWLYLFFRRNPVTHLEVRR